MIIKDPFGGSDIVIEFVSYNQSVQSTAGTQRVSIWCDEAPDFDFYEEQLPRLIAEDGDLIFTYTPVDRSSWLFDEFFEKARTYYRSKAICDFVGKGVEAEEITDSPYDIAVIMAATDDNPTLDVDVIDSLFAHVDDPDVISIRRYGIFKQLSGRIFKDFEFKTHMIDRNIYFPDGISYKWVHARGIDFHPQTPWAIVNMSISPTNEVFIWDELSMSPEKYTSREIAREIALIGKHYRFRTNIVDPLAEATKKDTITVREDLNKYFRDLSKEGIGMGGYWQTWDTKGERGRDSVRERLKNSLEVKRPFNNRVVTKGREEYLPTIWVLDNCKLVAKSMRNWRWEEWSDSKARAKNDEKNRPEQKWSHLNMCIECIFKRPEFRPLKGTLPLNQKPGYFRNRNART